MEAGLAKGRPAPEWYVEQPEIAQGDGLYLKAFRRLSTCRPSGMSIASIPWTAIVEYGKHIGFDNPMCDVLVVVIEAMDEAFCKWHNDQQDTTQAR